MRPWNQTWTDEAILDALDMYERQGMTAAAIAKVMRVTRSSVCGVLYRAISATDDAEVGSTVAKPENMDGGMPARWWERGRAA